LIIQNNAKDNIREIFSQIFLAGLLIFFAVTKAAAHCEIPCGIYDDEMRITMMAEHITTVEKSMKFIIDLEGQKPINHNQIIRWVVNKDHHADEIQHIVTQYFMTQRIKLEAKKYNEKLTLLHQMLIYAMKCKQSTDLSHPGTLRSLLEKFRNLYFENALK